MEQLHLHSGAVAYRRQIQIEDCLFENMKNTPYGDIRVADLCRQVGISRKAFYNYYRDKETCLRAYINRNLRESLLYTTRTVSGDATPLEKITVLLGYWKEHRIFLDVLVRERMLDLLAQEGLKCVHREGPSALKLMSTREISSDEDIMVCYVNLHITLLLQWHGRDFQPSAEEMARKLIRLTYEPILRLDKT